MNTTAPKTDEEIASYIYEHCLHWRVKCNPPARFTRWKAPFNWPWKRDTAPICRLIEEKLHRHGFQFLVEPCEGNVWVTSVKGIIHRPQTRRIMERNAGLKEIQRLFMEQIHAKKQEERAKVVEEIRRVKILNGV